MAKARFEDLVQQYPQLWEKAQKKFSSPQAQKKYFRSLVEAQKAREIEKQVRAKEKARERRRRTRALILFALWVLKAMEKDGWGFSVPDSKGKYHVLEARKFWREFRLIDKEGRYDVDYTPYLRRILKEEI